MKKLKGKTSSTARIKENRDLSLWKDITQTNTNKYPKNIYDSVLTYMLDNPKFKHGDIDLIQKRYNQALDYIKISEAVYATPPNVREKILRILRTLSKNRSLYISNIYVQAKISKKKKRTSSTTAQMDKPMSDSITYKEYAKIKNCSENNISACVVRNKKELSGYIYKVGNKIYLTPQAIKILDKHIGHGGGRGRKPSTKKLSTQSTSTTKVSKVNVNNKEITTKESKEIKDSKDNKYLKARVALAMAMIRETNAEYKEEYFIVLKDLNR